MAQNKVTKITSVVSCVTVVVVFVCLFCLFVFNKKWHRIKGDKCSVPVWLGFSTGSGTETEENEVFCVSL